MGSVVCGILLLLLGSQVAAQGLTPAQIARFSSMSQTEQQRLAKQFGIQLPQAQASSSQEAATDTLIKPGQTRRETSPSRHDSSREDTGLPLFGYDVFAGIPTSFTPIGDLPVPADYVVGPGDQLSIQLYGKENEQHLLTVGRNGAIDMPRLGPIPVAGKSFQQVREDLTLRIKKQIIGAEVSIGMGELRLMQVYVLGDANRPGAYNLSSLSTVSQALIAAGGVSETGSLRKIEVRRGKQRIAMVDLYDLLVRGSRAGDIRLQSGDAVFVHPVQRRIAVEGKVLRSAIYELSGKSTLQAVIDIAGGILPEGQRQRIQIERQTDTGIQVFTQNLATREGKQFLLQAGDHIRVPRRTEHYQNAVTLSGAFVQPGRHGYVAGMRVTDALGDLASNLRDDADLSLALLIREDDRHISTVRYLPLRLIEKNPRHKANVELKPGDELIVLPGTGFMRCSAQDLYTDEQRAQDAAVVGQALGQLENSDQQLSPSGDESSPNTVSRPVSVEQAFKRQQELAELEKKKLALKRRHCGLRFRYQQDQKIAKDLEGLYFAEQEDDSDFSTRLRDDEQNAVLELLTAERQALLAPVLEKLRLQARGGEVQQIVEIKGEVKYPGVYPYQPGMPMKQLLTVAGGLLESTYQQQGELTRLVNENGQLRLEHQPVALTQKAVAGLRLQARDRINIFKHPDWRNDLTVTLAGEVRFPGEYAIQRGDTLSDVIERAGGLTPFAFPQGSVLSRLSLKKREARELARLRDRLKEEVATLSLRKSTPISGLSVSPGEAIKAVEQLDAVDALGRLVINLPAALNGSEGHDIPLEDGDFLHVPAHTNTVSVIGEVQYPSSHVFEEGLSYKDYLAKAGGIRERADKKRIYVIRANGEVVVPRNSWFGASIVEGDTVVVPIDADYTDRLSLFSTVTQILYQLGIAYDVIKD